MRGSSYSMSCSLPERFLLWKLQDCSLLLREERTRRQEIEQQQGQLLQEYVCRNMSKLHSLRQSWLSIVATWNASVSRSNNKSMAMSLCDSSL